MTQFHVWLRGEALESVDSAIRITDVQELPPKELRSTARRCQGDGLTIIEQARQSLTVAVRFLIREARPIQRKAILRQVQTWAAPGGRLTISDRPGQFLNVVAEGLPTIESSLRWTDEMMVQFTACDVPYWEEEQTVECSPGRVYIPGNAPHTPVDFRWIVPGGAAALCISTPMSTITLQGLTASCGQELVLTHRQGILTATLGGADVLSARTPDSSDDLLLPCGQSSTISLTVNGSASQDGRFSARGRWL